MARMALMAPKRAQEERNAMCALFTSFAPFQDAMNASVPTEIPRLE